MGSQEQHKGMFLKHKEGGQKFSDSVMRGVIFVPCILEGGHFFCLQYKRETILSAVKANKRETILSAVKANKRETILSAVKANKRETILSAVKAIKRETILSARWNSIPWNSFCITSLKTNFNSLTKFIVSLRQISGSNLLNEITVLHLLDHDEQCILCPRDARFTLVLIIEPSDTSPIQCAQRVD